jgi:ATP/ADP translocase/HEAT repeat protein
LRFESITVCSFVVRRSFFDIRQNERRYAVGGFLSLFSIMAAHALLETARDTLFLSYHDARRLPWVYLTVALMALLVTLPVPRRTRRPDQRSVLVALQLAAAAVTLVFWFLAEAVGTWIYFALYVWSGVAATVIVMRLWLLLGEFFSAHEAKRVYAYIGTGGVLGVTVGFAFAGLLAAATSPRALLLACAGLGAAGALLSWLVFSPPKRRDTEPSPEPPRRLRDGSADRSSVPLDLLAAGRTALAHPYVRRVTAMVVLSTITVTVVDYLFKSVLSHSVATAQLSTYLASTYFSLNLLSLGVLLFVVSPFLKRFGVAWALPILPAFLILGGAAVILGGGLLAALCLKGAEGTLRHSLHKTAIEILYLPMSNRLRESVRSFIDVIGQRGGQALASVAILFLVPFENNESLLAMMVTVLAVFWIIGTVDTQKHYLDAFRATLSEGEIGTRISFPELDMASLETLLTALNSPNDREVIGAMDILSAKQRGQLVSPLILYHPSAAVIIHALDLFLDQSRTDFVPLVDRLLDHPDAAVRAAAVRARIAVAPDRQWLENAREKGCTAVEATVVAGLAALGWLDRQEAPSRLRKIAAHQRPEPRIALARVAQLFPDPVFHEVVRELARSADAAVRAEAVRAIRQAGADNFLPDLVALLADRSVREPVRQALVSAGDRALEYLDGKLSDLSLPDDVRRHIPRTISRFPPPAAVGVLVRHLDEAAGGMVQHKILRGLGRLLADNPDIKPDLDALSRAERRAMATAYRLLAWRITLQRERESGLTPDTPGGQLLTRLLRDKQEYAVERLFRLLGLHHSGGEFRRIFRALQSRHRQLRSNSRELLENLLPAAYRLPVLALVDELGDEARLQRGRDLLHHRPATTEEVLRQLLQGGSRDLSTLAHYHAAELGLAHLHRDRPPGDEDDTKSLSGIRHSAVDMMKRIDRAPAG